MHFQYVAKRRSGETVRSRIESESLLAARQTLRTEGLFVVSLTASSQGDALAADNSRRNRRTIASNDLMMFLSQLTIMIRSGVDLSEALNNVTAQTGNTKFRAVLESVAGDVCNGVAFSDALSRHPTVFDSTISSGIAAGEHSGDLAGVLDRLSRLIRNDVKLRGTVRSMLMYPLVLCSITMLVLFAMMFFVLPQFAQVFEGLGRPAPPITQALLNIGHTFRSNVFLILGTGGVALAIFAGVRKTERFQQKKDHLVLYFPLIYKASRALIGGRVLRLLGTLICAGIPLTECIRLCRRSTRNRLFHQLFEQIERDVLNGDGLSKPMLTASFLPQGAAQMVQTGENSGKLGDVLQTIGEFYEDEGERHLRDLIKIAEPAIIVFLGGVVATVVLAVLIPLLDVTTMTDA